MANDPRFEVYPRVTARKYSREGEDLGVMSTGDFGWRFRAANGQISAVSGEGFTRREDAHRAVSQFLVSLADTGIDLGDAVPTAAVIDVDE